MIVGYGTSEGLSITPGLRRGRLSLPYLGTGQAPVSGHGAGFYGDVGVELPCINLGASVAFVGDEAF